MKKIILILLLISHCISKAQSIYPTGIPDCIARWKFSSNGIITTVPDVSNNGHTGTANNLTATNGFRSLPNKAMSFNGTSSWSQVPNNTDLSPQQITIISLVKYNGFYSGTCQGNQIISKGYPYFIPGNYGLAATDNVYDNSCNIYSPNFTQSASQYANASYAITPGNYISLNTWYFIATSYDGNNAKIYQVVMDTAFHYSNIAPIYSFTGLNTPIGTNTQDISIGKHLNPTYPYWFNGSMDELALFRRVLSDSEVQNIYDYLWGLIFINRPFADTLLCQGSAFNLNYTLNDSEIFQAGNIFTVQLSDAIGNFASPVNIGSLAATNSGLIPCTIPTGTPAGNGYRIRIVGNIPVYVSTDTGIVIKIGSGTLSSPIAANNSPKCPGDTLKLSASSNITGLTYNWIGPNGFTSQIQNPVIANAQNIDSGIYTVTISSGGCNNSSNTHATLYPDVAPSFSTAGNYCTGNLVSIQSGNLSLSSSDYIWNFNGANILSGQGAGPYTLSWENSGNKTISLSIVGNCQLPDSQYIYIRPSPQNSILASKTTFQFVFYRLFLTLS